MTKDWIGQSCAPWTTPAQASPRIGRLGNRLFRTGGLIALALLFGCGGGSGASTPVPTSGPAATPTPTPTLTSVEFSRQLSPGWNLGNSLDAIGGGTGPHATSQETAWGNPTATQALFDSVKAAGFNSVRIPVSWAQYADLNNTISIFWLDRVAQVVDYARNAGLYVIINVHWDGGRRWDDDRPWWRRHRYWSYWRPWHRRSWHDHRYGWDRRDYEHHGDRGDHHGDRGDHREHRRGDWR